MNDYFKEIILKATGSKNLYKIKKIQNLWSNYGEISRYALTGSIYKSVVVKHIKLPENNNNISHNRKIKSYKVEKNWYENYSAKCKDICRIPEFLGQAEIENEILFILEDLNESGFPDRRNFISIAQIKKCLKWLANFHALFLNEKPKGLWRTGTYWHLDTRPDELKALNDSLLKKAAKKIDQKLNMCNYKTFVHGDAKLANFCFSKDSSHIAALDFQYVGGGCGMKDIAYFISSCLPENDCEKYENELLTSYFNSLDNALKTLNKNIDFNNIKKEWHELYHYAWVDFYRFLKGWSPGYYNKKSYSEKITNKIIEKLK